MNDFVKNNENKLLDYCQIIDGKIHFTWDDFRKGLTDFSAALVAKILKDMPWNVMPCGCDKKSRRPKEGPHCNQEGRYAALCEVRDFLEGLSQFK